MLKCLLIILIRFVFLSMDISKPNLSKYLSLISYQVMQYKISFNTNSSKQDQDVIFSRNIEDTKYVLIHLRAILFNKFLKTFKTFRNYLVLY